GAGALSAEAVPALSPDTTRLNAMTLIPMTFLRACGCISSSLLSLRCFCASSGSSQSLSRYTKGLRQADCGTRPSSPSPQSHARAWQYGKEAWSASDGVCILGYTTRRARARPAAAVKDL